jgi:hypothetical protein
VGTKLGARGESDEPNLPDASPVAVSHVTGRELGSEFCKTAPDDVPVSVGSIASFVRRDRPADVMCINSGTVDTLTDEHSPNVVVLHFSEISVVANSSRLGTPGVVDSVNTLVVNCSFGGLVDVNSSRVGTSAVVDSVMTLVVKCSDGGLVDVNSSRLCTPGVVDSVMKLVLN